MRGRRMDSGGQGFSSYCNTLSYQIDLYYLFAPAVVCTVQNDPKYYTYTYLHFNALTVLMRRPSTCNGFI